jgi:branched-chain amino acid transport system ATP-binding protein
MTNSECPMSNAQVRGAAPESRPSDLGIEHCALDIGHSSSPPPSPTGPALLELDRVSVAYGPVQALREVSLRVEAGEVVALLGANGAGKSSALAAVAGLVRASRGAIRLAGQDLSRLQPSEIVRRGVALAPEGRRLFAELTVLENLEMGAYTVRDKAAIRAKLDRAFHYFPVLAERRGQEAATLSGGEQQMLAVARALMSSPRLLMLDEPSLGLAPMLVDQIFQIIAEINRQEGVAILLVEQNAAEALAHAARAYVLENGRIALDGPANEVARDPRVIDAYLGP